MRTWFEGEEGRSQTIGIHVKLVECRVAFDYSLAAKKSYCVKQSHICRTR